MTKDVDYFLIHLLDICNLSFENHLSISLAHLLMALFAVLIYSLLSSLCILYTVLYQIYGRKKCMQLEKIIQSDIKSESEILHAFSCLWTTDF